jgi:hypothetical protein
MVAGSAALDPLGSRTPTTARRSSGSPGAGDLGAVAVPSGIVAGSAVLDPLGTAAAA